jgi:hypothetical protein
MPMPTIAVAEEELARGEQWADVRELCFLTVWGGRRKALSLMGLIPRTGGLACLPPPANSVFWEGFGTRAMTIQYDASDLSGWIGLPKLFFRLKGTILTGTINSPLFWLCNLVHIGFLILGGQIRIGTYSNVSETSGEVVFTSAFEPYDLSGSDLKLGWSMATFGLPLLFFFIVFYNNNSYQRYFQLYSHTVGLGAKTMEWTALVKLNTPEDASSLGELPPHSHPAPIGSSGDHLTSARPM